MTTHPLVVDLDGTLVHTDMLHESALQLLRDAPLAVLRIPGWLMQGKAQLKQHLAARCPVDPAGLPYNTELLQWLQAQRAAGRKLILCTASDRQLAQPIADHLGLFDEVMASDGQTNLAGAAKAAALVQRFGPAGFDYAGNSSADVPVWQHARRAIVVSTSAALVDQARACCELEKHIQPPVAGLAIWLRMLRTHQWLKNVLLCVPLLGAHKLTDTALWLSLAMAFVAFGLCASAVYVTNDLLDLHSDRHHPHKRTRALAAGTVAAWQGVLLAPALLAAGLALAAQVTPGFLGWMLCYVGVTSAYSLWIKRLLLIDCLVLASLYMLRVVAGAAAVNFGLTFWLLAFSGFLFLSLAFVKRYAELSLHSQHGTAPSTRRAYRVSDAPLVQTLGVTSGVAAAVLLALYLNSDAVLRLYRTPALMWAAVPVLLFWISWMWMQAHRGAMHDDPLVFAVRDRASLWSGAAFAGALALGSLGWAG